MDLDSVPGRISLGVITLLAVSSQAGLGMSLFIYNLCHANLYHKVTIWKVASDEHLQQ